MLGLTLREEFRGKRLKGTAIELSNDTNTGATQIAATALLVYLAYRYPDVLTARDGRINLTQSLIWLGIIGASLFLHRRLPLGHALRYAAIWIALGALLVLAYSFRHDAQHAWRRSNTATHKTEPLTACWAPQTGQTRA